MTEDQLDNECFDDCDEDTEDENQTIENSEDIEAEADEYSIEE